ncbi:hypothetical protein [Nocardioides ferulae]|uniref:hypothetical protein n=1 Tax=Nocardioides ferulae TaxID=2340821 RepID=UPI000EB0E4DF|nr:hypothetical protein [Nocardioides ferulae]
MSAHRFPQPLVEWMATIGLPPTDPARTRAEEALAEYWVTCLWEVPLWAAHAGEHLVEALPPSDPWRNLRVTADLADEDSSTWRMQYLDTEGLPRGAYLPAGIRLGGPHDTPPPGVASASLDPLASALIGVHAVSIYDTLDLAGAIGWQATWQTVLAPAIDWLIHHHLAYEDTDVAEVQALGTAAQSGDRLGHAA